MRLKYVSLVTAVVVLGFAGISTAKLLDNQLYFPQITFNSGGITSYDANLDVLTIKALPVAIRLMSGAQPLFINAPEVFSIGVCVDKYGQLTGGVSGDDLVVVGKVDLEGSGGNDPVSGTLLTGEALAFGFDGSAESTTDSYDFRFVVTGGLLEHLFYGQDISVNVSSESSTFTGDFTGDFGGKAKGTLGSNKSDCLIEVNKTCCIPPPPVPGADDCQGKVIRMVLQYAGDNCSATTNGQEGKATCSGDPDGAEPVSIIYTGKDTGKITVSPDSGIEVGDTFSITATDRPELHANTKLQVKYGDELLQSLTIHTSCSKALNVGDRFGSMLVVEFETTEGGTVVFDPNPFDAESTSACVPPGFPEGTCCDSRLIEAVFEYTGHGCADPLDNPQDGKARCSGNPADIEPVSIIYTGKGPDKITVSPASGINIGDTFRVTATGRAELHSNTRLQISDSAGVLQSLEIHTSCSQPLALGDVFGSLRLVEFTTKDGGTKAIGNSDAPIFFEACEVPAAPPAPHCTSKIRELTLRYIGGDCMNSSNLQENKAECNGDDPAADVSITFARDADKFLATPNSGINVNDKVTIAKNDGSDFPAEIKFNATGEGGTQSLNIHTSCSQPLNLGDCFGAFEVFSMDLKDQGFVSLGGQVEYQYTITNKGSETVEITSVFDSRLGELIDVSFSLNPGESNTLFKTATIFETTTNEVTVMAEVMDCVAMDSVTVTVAEPPPGPFECKDAKPVDELTMIWNGSQDIRIKAYKGDTTQELLADIDGIIKGAEVTVPGFSGSPNDVIWEIFEAGTDNKIGESTFHLSCSDPDMNGQEDCRKPQGDGKDKSGFINEWLFEGMAGNGLMLDCTP